MARRGISRTVTEPTAETDNEKDGIGRRLVAKLAVLVPPWLVLGATAVAGAVSHAKWGQQPEVTWAAMAGTLATTALTALTWAITHARKALGRVHATATTAAAGLWLTVVTVTGLGPEVVTGALWWGGSALALSWNLRAVIRALDPDQGSGDALGQLFDRAKEQAGLKGARARAREVTDRKVKGVLALPPGQATADDAQKAVAKLESGMQVPPGTLTVAPDPDRADLVQVTMSDPRVLRKPIPWPGPSRPAASIADPIRVGVWQDGDDCEFKVPGKHLQLMGMTGSGKSIGGAWNTLGELFTRTDAAVFGIDTSKSDQTLGPLREGMARLETNKAGAVALLRAIHANIPQRTQWLADHGFSNWEKGCGLTYWVLWIEEAAKLLNSLSSKDEDRFEEIMKEARSAGVSVELSLQRSDYTQMPTLVRSQLGKMCFGLAEADDARWGLTNRQQKADNVEPEMWENYYPGMAHLDTAGVSEKHAVMPLRTYDWGARGRLDMAAHAGAYAFADKQVDAFTANLAAGQNETATGHQGGASADPVDLVDPEDVDDLDGEDDLDEDGVDEDVVDDVLTEAAAMDPDLADPDPTVTATVGPDSPIQLPTPEEDAALVTDQTPPQKLSPADSRAALDAWLADRTAAGRRSFKASDDDLADLRHSLGMSRSWTYKVLAELVAVDRLSLDNGIYTITDNTDDGTPESTDVAA